MQLYDGTISEVNTCEEEENNGTNRDIKFEDLIDMDVVIYSLDKINDNDNDNDNGNNNNNLSLGAIQEDGILSPLSAWTIEPAFGESIEFLVHEDDRFLLSNKNENNSIIGTGTSTSTSTSSVIRIHHLLSESEVSYSCRQCHRGVDNPHGEESELIYYISQTLIDEYTQNPLRKIHVSMKPDLEILW